MIIYNGVNFQSGIQMGDNVALYPTYSISASKLLVTESNDSVVFTINTTGVVDGTLLYWSLSGTYLPNQIAVNTGAVKIVGATGTITINTLPNMLSNGPKDFRLSLRTDSIQGNIVVSSPLINIVDSSNPITGQTTYTTPGTYTFTVPNNVYVISALCVGAGGTGCNNTGKNGGGGGGGLGWKNNIIVSPGQQFTVVVGAGNAGGSAYGPGVDGGDSYFISPSTVAGFGGKGGTSSGAVALGGSFAGDGGGNGGNGGIDAGNQNEGQGAGGGGAGGYNGNGGNGGNSQGNQTQPTQPTAGQGGGGGGGGATWGTLNGNGNAQSAGSGGGGVGILGQGSNGSATPTTANYVASVGGGAGSGGTAGGNGTANFAASERSGSGGTYGGGSGATTGAGMSNGPANYVSAAGGGAVRIIWGPGRSYPASGTTDQPVVL